jgi:hypothetical protein
MVEFERIYGDRANLFPAILACISPQPWPSCCLQESFASIARSFSPDYS